MDVWGLYPCELATYTVAKALLGITASEASVERTFSAQDAVHTKKRNRLQHHTVEQEMFVRFNTRALDRQQQFRHSSTNELLIDHTADTTHDSDDDEAMEEKRDDSDIEMEEAHHAAAASSSAAAVAAAPIRSHSELLTLGDEWLLKYAESRGIVAGYKWSREDKNAIEAAALSAPFTLGTGQDMVKRIAELLAAN